MCVLNDASPQVSELRDRELLDCLLRTACSRIALILATFGRGWRSFGAICEDSFPQWNVCRTGADASSAPLRLP